jgi:hypothetical protein
MMELMPTTMREIPVMFRAAVMLDKLLKSEALRDEFVVPMDAEDVLKIAEMTV